MDSNSHRLSPLYYKRTEIYTEILNTKIRDTEILYRDLCNTIANLIRKLCSRYLQELLEKQLYLLYVMTSSHQKYTQDKNLDVKLPFMQCIKFIKRNIIDTANAFKSLNRMIRFHNLSK